ncbi:hypothetical protein [Hyphomonas sp.]|uniref:hypothetical protein n=1 Tax=Hyphomonas sp. TaxID=87 RepID=UPI003527AE9A
MSSAKVRFLVDGAVSPGVVPGGVSVSLTDSGGSSNEVLRLSASGNVGLGVGAPTVNLHLTGAIRLAVIDEASLPSAASTGEGALIFADTASDGVRLAYSDGTDWRRVDTNLSL